MTIEDAVRARYNRFNRLWLKAIGHPFEKDDDDKAWEQEAQKILEKYGFSSVADYGNHKFLSHDSENGKIQEIEDIIEKRPRDLNLYEYEKTCIDEAVRGAKWVIENKGMKWWDKISNGKTIGEVNDSLERAGFKVHNGLSCNSFFQSIRFIACLLNKPEQFQYLPGSMALLVGNEGYYDDRSDVPTC